MGGSAKVNSVSKFFSDVCKYVLWYLIPEASFSPTDQRICFFFSVTCVSKCSVSGRTASDMEDEILTSSRTTTRSAACLCTISHFPSGTFRGCLWVCGSRCVSRCRSRGAMCRIVSSGNCSGNILKSRSPTACRLWRSTSTLGNQGLGEFHNDMLSLDYMQTGRPVELACRRRVFGKRDS